MDQIVSTEVVDKLIESELSEVFNSITGYVFEGEEYNRINFYRLLLFENEELFKKSSLDITKTVRWINTYYWHSIYLKELKNQQISIDNHLQQRFRIVELIGMCADKSFNWKIIEEIDGEMK